MNTPVSFKLAKLLKEKGFDLHTFTYYRNSETFIHSSAPYECKYNDSKNSLSAPTIAQVLMWLYEKYKIWINSEMDYSYSSEKTYHFGKVRFFDENKFIKEYPTKSYDAPIEAYEAAIEYTLTKLI